VGGVAIVIERLMMKIKDQGREKELKGLEHEGVFYLIIIAC
jgi:hypothetical protein